MAYFYYNPALQLRDVMVHARCMHVTFSIYVYAEYSKLIPWSTFEYEGRVFCRRQARKQLASELRHVAR